MIDKIGVIGGLGTLASADLFYKLLGNKTVLGNQLDYHFLFEQQPYSQINLPLHQEEDIKSRKFYSYNVSKSFENCGVTKILLPCFASHTFLEELQKEIAIPIVNIYEALIDYIKPKFIGGSKIGVLTSSFVKESKNIHRVFNDYDLVFPEDQSSLMSAIYGEHGIKNGHLDGIALEHVHEACSELLAKGCQVIVPGITDLSLVAEQLWRRGIRLLDVNQIYADYVLANSTEYPKKPFKLGILGGVGPSATVDFMQKIIQNTPASKDQDHIKMVVEQNPQIPDRTANLLFQQTDPTVAMFSTCKRLEAEGADAIAIPCNTAHAFVRSIQEYLTIPIINMLEATAIDILSKYGNAINVGLLATTGTISSRVYHEALEEFGLKVIAPDNVHQDLVMESIYGKKGVKAGYFEGVCKQHILLAANFVIGQGADVIVLGCTELPLMFANQKDIITASKEIPLVDPTLVLAKEVLKIATST